MALVISDMSISLDGYVTGPNDSRENPFGDGAEMLHDWMFDAATDDDRAILQAALDGVGAIVMGRKSFDNAEGNGHPQRADRVAPTRVRCGQRHRAGQERGG
jgi:dihydrofolate reductase